MYLCDTITDKKEMAGLNLLGILFSPTKINKADRLEVWSSSFKDDGGDFNMFRLMDGETIIAEKRQEGY